MTETTKIDTKEMWFRSKSLKAEKNRRQFEKRREKSLVARPFDT